MILDDGKASVYRTRWDGEAGNMYGGDRVHVYTGWFGFRNVGFSRYFAARQVDANVDALIRMLCPPASSRVRADDLVELSVDGDLYRIVQAQYLRDEDAGEEVVDLTLQRIGEKYNGPTERPEPPCHRCP